MALIDTGATGNFMSRETVSALGSMVRDDKSLTISVVNDQKIKVDKSIEITFKFKDLNKEHHMKYYVIDKCSYDVIIGNEFIMNSNCILSFMENSVQIDTETLGFDNGVNKCLADEILMGHRTRQRMLSEITYKTR